MNSALSIQHRLAWLTLDRHYFLGHVIRMCMIFAIASNL